METSSDRSRHSIAALFMQVAAFIAAASKDGAQGEGNYEAAREFNAAERKFVASGKVAAAARAAAPKSEAERQAMFAAEEEGKRRAKE